MFSRDEMQRAIEDALKQMEGVALELYRRGREEAREELEEARARNADMRAMLEQVTRERDEARAELAALRKRVVEALPYPTDDDSDESRTAEEAIEMAVAERDAAYRSRDLAIKMWDEERALRIRLGVEVKFLRERTGYMREDVEERWKRLISERDKAFRRGAEAMREACAQWFREHDESFELTVDACHDVIADMPIPEES